MNSIILNALGIIGNIAFGVGCVPTAWRTWRGGKSIGTPVSLAWTLSTACASFYVYMVGTYGWNPMVWVIGLVETLSWLTVLWYHYFPRQPFEHTDFMGPGY